MLGRKRQRLLRRWRDGTCGSDGCNLYPTSGHTSDWSPLGGCPTVGGAGCPLGDCHNAKHAKAETECDRFGPEFHKRLPGEMDSRCWSRRRVTIPSERGGNDGTTTFVMEQDESDGGRARRGICKNPAKCRMRQELSRESKKRATPTALFTFPAILPAFRAPWAEVSQ